MHTQVVIITAELAEWLLLEKRREFARKGYLGGGF